MRSRRRTLAWRGRLLVAIGSVLLTAGLAPAALAVNRIYWGDPADGTISFANLDGSGGLGNLDASGATVGRPDGIAIDPADGKIYWANVDGTISFANLAGGGGGDVNTRGATVNNPIGIAIDPSAGKIYWANEGATAAPGISFARLDGSGGGDLNTGAATIDHPTGLAIDPTTGRIFWGNFNAGISFAFLDGSGGGDLATTGATVTSPEGVAIDHSTQRIYWANFNGDRISFANLNGIGGGDVRTTGATVDFPIGVDVDTAAGKIYWTNGLAGATGPEGLVSFANLDNSGGGDLYTARVGGTFPALLEAPAGAAAPTITGGGSAPTTLGCTQGIWGPDLRESLLYRAPQSFSFRWFRNGTTVTGATGSLIQASSSGSYTCSVTARNFAGSSSRSSAPFAVAPPPPPPTASATASTSGPTASVAVTCHGIIGQVCAGGLTLTTRPAGVRARGGPRPGAAPVNVGGGSYRAAAGATVTIPLALNRTGRRILGRQFTLPATLSFSGTTAPPRLLTFSLARIHINHHLLVWRIVVGSFTTASSLSVQPVPLGATISVVCQGGGCPFHRRNLTAHRSHVSLTGLFGRHHLRPGTRVTFEITAPGTVGERISYILQARGTVRRPTIMCVAPGARRAVRC